MAPVVGGPLLAAAGALTGSRLLSRLGVLFGAGSAAAMADIGLRDAVPGANDNGSAVVALLAIAQRLQEQGSEKLRVILLSTGSEESFSEGMKAFGERHFGALPRGRTTFLCLESVGSPQLMLLSGEGLFRLERYPGGPIGMLGQLAAQAGVQLRPPFRYRLATDGQVPLRAGYQTAVISSMDWYKAPSNYHWPSDRPENLGLDSIAGAATLAEAYVRHLDGDPAT
jgi:hypothetical protein